MINSVTKVDSVIRAYTNANTTAKPSRTPAKTDHVSISATAQDFRTALEAVSKVSDVREDRVREISERINSGQYNVSSMDIASKILEKSPWRVL
ncbi:MAG: flagellar biosynthesis anti-sigma factor FlgM [Defluviitaleaceae bacterium]|nr:flagellar biosynthesis anti-sigma factor FlgM [Defluviitaleaceae bacterium]